MEEQAAKPNKAGYQLIGSTSDKIQDNILNGEKRFLYIALADIFKYTKAGEMCNHGYTTLQFRNKSRVSDISNIIKTFDPHIIKFGGYSLIPRIEQARKAAPNAKIFHFNGDQRGKVQNLFIAASEYTDYILTSSMGQVKDYQNVCKNKVEFWPCEPMDYFYGGDPSTERKFDIFFSGKTRDQFPDGAKRRELLALLSSKYKCLMYGSAAKARSVGHEILAKEIEKAKISIGINAYNNVEMYTSNRFWTQMCSGSLHITHYVPGMENYFTNHEDCVWFETIDECMELVKFYLENDEKRITVANNERNLILAKHTASHRMKEIIDWAETGMANTPW